MTFFRTAAAASVLVVAMTVAGCGSGGAGQSTPTTSTSSSVPAGPAGGATAASGVMGGSGGGTIKPITAKATATLAKALGVTSARLTEVLDKARAQGGGVNLVRTLSTELKVSETKVAAGLKALGSDGP